MAFLLVTGLSVGVVTYVTNRSIQTALTNNVGDSLHSLAALKGEAAGDLLARQIANLQAFALSKVVQDGVERVSDSYIGTPAEISARIDTLDKLWHTAKDTDSV